jgi:hypothetical protein
MTTTDNPDSLSNAVDRGLDDAEVAFPSPASAASTTGFAQRQTGSTNQTRHTATPSPGIRPLRDPRMRCPLVSPLFDRSAKRIAPGEGAEHA